MGMDPNDDQDRDPELAPIVAALRAKAQARASLETVRCCQSKLARGAEG